MKSLIVMSLAILALSSLPILAQEKVLTINSFGGSYEEAHRRCVIDPFEQKTGARVQIVTAYSSDAFAQLRAQKQAPQFDIIHFSGGQEIVGAAENLLEPIDPSKLAHAADLYDFARANMAKGEGPAYSIAALGLIYNTQKNLEEPTSWRDLFQPSIADHLILTDISNGYGMLSFLMLNQIEGGNLDNIQPGLDAVAEMLDNGAIIISRSPEIQQEFVQNDAWIAPYASDYAYTLRLAGLPTKFIQAQEGTPASFVTVNLVAGRPNSDLAHQFIDETISASAQECFAQALRYTPTNKKVVLDADIAADVAYGETAVQNLIRFDPVKIETNRSSWVEAWNKTIAR